MNTHPTATLPSGAQLAKATAVAVAVAAAILLSAVLPAEYGIDPTGAGAKLGLARLNGGAATAPAPAPAAVPSQNLVKSDIALRNDEMTLTLKPGEGAEVKAQIRKGGQFVFSWQADAPVKADMHGEPFNAKEREFTTYWKVPQQSGANGTFTAPFDGIHGWFWRNKGDKPVTITVRVSGFQEKLFRPS